MINSEQKNKKQKEKLMSEQNKKIIYVSKETDEKITDKLRAEILSHEIELRVLEKEPLVIGLSGEKSREMMLEEEKAEIVVLKEPIVMELRGEELLKMATEHIEIIDPTIEYENKPKKKKYVPKKMGNELKAKIKNVRGKRYGR